MPNSEIELRKVLFWLFNGETGISSKTIAAVMTGTEIVKHNWKIGSPPQDPSDYLRCRKLLEIFPEWKKRLNEVSAKFPHWRQLIDHWDEIENIYLREQYQESAPILYRRMSELLGHKS